MRELVKRSFAQNFFKFFYYPPLKFAKFWKIRNLVFEISVTRQKSELCDIWRNAKSGEKKERKCLRLSREGGNDREMQLQSTRPLSLSSRFKAERARCLLALNYPARPPPCVIHLTRACILMIIPRMPLWSSTSSLSFRFRVDEVVCSPFHSPSSRRNLVSYRDDCWRTDTTRD